MIKAFRKIKLIKLEVFATILWFLTDFLWMWGFVIPAVLLLPFIVISMVISVIRVKSKNLKRIIIITMMWLMMNSVWMISDLTTDQTVVIFCKVIASTFGAIGFMQLTIFFITKPKTIKNFRRFLNVNHETI